MTTQILECHGPMLIQSTIAFERIVKRENKKGQGFGKSGSDVTWDNPVELETYISEVQEAANNLIREN